MKRTLSVTEAASALGVSGATVRNWARRGLLALMPGQRRLVFDPVQVAMLHEAIASGTVSRLRQRANKSRVGCGQEAGDGSNGSWPCGTDGLAAAERRVIRRVAESVAAQTVPCQVALPVLALAVLRDAGLVTPAAARRAVASGLRHVPCAHAGLTLELERWGAALPVGAVRAAAGLLDLRPPRGRDVLGLLYQHLRVEGDRHVHGAYYTPAPVAASMAGQYFDPCATVLDPCCGTGQFLLAFAALGAQPDRLYGMDSDPNAVRVARINLMLAFPDLAFDPRIRCANALFTACAHGFDAMPAQYDRVMTNPPWGGAFSATEAARLRAQHPEIASRESFAHFLRRGMTLLAPGGVLSYLLPEAVLHVAAHADVRRYLLAHGHVERIDELGRVFSQVFTPVVRIDVRRDARPDIRPGIGPATPQAASPHAALRPGVHRDSPCVRALRASLSDEDFAFNVRLTGQDMGILDRMFAVPHATLRQGADWALGIVTGDNDRYVCAAPGPGTEPIIRGRDVAPYALGRCTAHIRFVPGQFQQVAPEQYYRAGEKLVYRFVSRQLVVAYDNAGRLTLNSANCVLPRVEGYPVKAVLALFNTPLYRYALQQLFGSLKVLKRHLQSLPLPLWPPDTLGRLEGMADGVLRGVLAQWAIDDYVMHTFGLTDTEVERILSRSPRGAP